MDLAKRAVACKRWRWMPGMACVAHGQPIRILNVGREGVQFDRGWKPTSNLREAIPNITDPATLGCLLALVREAHADPYLCTDFDGHTWSVIRFDCVTTAYGTSEAEALIAALEAAPEK